MSIMDFRGGAPVYMQLKERLRGYIISGVYKPDERMPSVREMATSLSVNMNTIQRAYRELEDEGYIYTVSGTGSFVSNSAHVIDKRKEEIMTRFIQEARELLFLGVNPKELISKIEEESADD